MPQNNVFSIYRLIEALSFWGIDFKLRELTIQNKVDKLLEKLINEIILFKEDVYLGEGSTRVCFFVTKNIILKIDKKLYVDNELFKTKKRNFLMREEDAQENYLYQEDRNNIGIFIGEGYSTTEVNFYKKALKENLFFLECIAKVYASNSNCSIILEEYCTPLGEKDDIKETFIIKKEFESFKKNIFKQMEYFRELNFKDACTVNMGINLQGKIVLIDYGTFFIDT